MLWGVENAMGEGSRAGKYRSACGLKPVGREFVSPDHAARKSARRRNELRDYIARLAPVVRRHVVSQPKRPASGQIKRSHALALRHVLS